MTHLDTSSHFLSVPNFFRTSPRTLLYDLYRAYKGARQHKRGKDYQIHFEMRLEEELTSLRDEIMSKTYNPRHSTCFMVHEPKMREVFAADFRDRVVHHLFFNYTHVLFERTFITDSYSCIRGKGTHFGINRLRHHILSQSRNHTRPCYILKIDISGYFMHIDRQRLLKICRGVLAKMHDRPSDVHGLTWGQKLDYELLDYLLETIVLIDPTQDCTIIGDLDDWTRLPKDKSLFTVEEGCGLPIGNLTSQLFSNIFLNEFDQFVKRTLKCKHYGRYVDDAYVVAGSKAELRRLVPQMERFLNEHLGLGLHMRKVLITPAHHGVDFLGAFVKPWRTYVANHTLSRMRGKMNRIEYGDPRRLQAQVNSRLGMLRHFNTYYIRSVMFRSEEKLLQYGAFTQDMLKYVPNALRKHT